MPWTGKPRMCGVVDQCVNAHLNRPANAPEERLFFLILQVVSLEQRHGVLLIRRRISRRHRQHSWFYYDWRIATTATYWRGLGAWLQ